MYSSAPKSGPEGCLVLGNHPDCYFLHLHRESKVDIILYSQHLFPKIVDTEVRYKVQRAGWQYRPSTWMIITPHLTSACRPQMEPPLLYLK